MGNRLIAGICALGIVFLSNAASSADEVHLNVASTFPKAMPVLGDVSRRLPELVSRLSGGELQLDFHDPGELAPAAETVDAIATGKIPAAWAGATWFASKDSAFNLFSSVPFGPGIAEYIAWLYYGGGLVMSREMFHAYGVHNVPCGLIPSEASGWFQKEIKAVEDLKGLKMRFFGLGAKVMEKHGVVTVQLPPGEVLEALQSGAIDAAEFSLPAMDQQLGFQGVAKFYYFPGWHQQVTLFDLYVNKTVWDGLAEKHRAIIETACGETMRDMLAEGEARQWKAIKEMQAMGVKLKRWPAQILLSYENAWKEIVAEESANNPNFKRVYDSFAAFRENYAVWTHFNSLQ